MVEVDLSFFVNDFLLETNLVLDREAFIYALTRSPCLSFSSPLNMVYEFLQDYFVFDDSTSGFEFFLEMCKHIIHGHVPPLISCLLVASRLLALDKQIKGV